MRLIHQTGLSDVEMLERRVKVAVDSGPLPVVGSGLSCGSGIVDPCP